MDLLKASMAAKGLKFKLSPVLGLRSGFLKVLIMVKVIKALTKPSIKGQARNVVQVVNDRLFSALVMINEGQWARMDGTCSHTGSLLFCYCMC